jgi:hypothetical protein
MFERGVPPIVATDCIDTTHVIHRPHGMQLSQAGVLRSKWTPSRQCDEPASPWLAQASADHACDPD